MGKPADKPKKLTKKQRADEWYRELKGSGDPIVWTKENRDRFRETTYWRKFSERMKKSTCDFCTCKSKTLTVHHLYPAAYDDLRPHLFKVLCWSCHVKAGQLSRRKDKSTIPDYFLGFIERSGFPDD